jgi:aminoglycoside 3'-phosphotransferase-2
VNDGVLPSVPDVAPTPGRLPDGVAAIVGALDWQPVDGGRSASEVWRATRADGTTVYLKMAAPAGPGDGSELLRAEHDRLQWLAGRLPVPEVVAWADDHETGQVHLVTTALSGHPASSDEHRGDVETLIRALASGLRAVHALPVEGCPFDTRLDVRLAEAEARVAAGLVDEDDFEPAYRRYTASRLFELLTASRPSGDEDVVVVHGDYSLANVLLDGDTIAGYLDVGRLGVADRYVDLAVAARDIANLISPHALGPFFDAYGIDQPELLKLDFYVLLDEFF